LTAACAMGRARPLRRKEDITNHDRNKEGFPRQTTSCACRALTNGRTLQSRHLLDDVLQTFAKTLHAHLLSCAREKGAFEIFELFF
jgi:hypothetical protein